MMWFAPEAFGGCLGAGVFHACSLFVFLCMQVLFVLLTAMKKVSSRHPGLSLLFATFAIIACGSCDLFVWKSSLGELSPKVSGEGLICAYVTLLQPGARFSVWLFLDRRNCRLVLSTSVPKVSNTKYRTCPKFNNNFVKTHSIFLKTPEVCSNWESFCPELRFFEGAFWCAGEHVEKTSLLYFENFTLLCLDKF